MEMELKIAHIHMNLFRLWQYNTAYMFVSCTHVSFIEEQMMLVPKSTTSATDKQFFYLCLKRQLYALGIRVSNKFCSIV